MVVVVLQEAGQNTPLARVTEGLLLTLDGLEEEDRGQVEAPEDAVDHAHELDVRVVIQLGDVLAKAEHPEDVRVALLQPVQEPAHLALARSGQGDEKKDVDGGGHWAPRRAGG